ncbi:hypothetical protein GF420_15730 [candidate division GN15 bacterium]|nr:hypothetical protein [candidate division GN15 bacterium]
MNSRELYRKAFTREYEISETASAVARTPGKVGYRACCAHFNMWNRLKERFAKGSLEVEDILEEFEAYSNEGDWSDPWQVREVKSRIKRDIKKLRRIINER